MVNVAVIYYSATGNVRTLAEGVAAGARDAGADVRLLRVRELATPEAIARNPKWQRHVDAVRDEPEATLQDLEWADAAIFGSPTRFSNMRSTRSPMSSSGPTVRTSGVMTFPIAVVR